MKVFYALVLVIVLSSCQTENANYESYTSDLDDELITNLINASNGVGTSYYLLPDSDDFSRIPQDPLSPITAEKVALGKLLLHETALGGNPKMDEMNGQYTCATCHPVASGFFSGRRQGIGEGGIGFGVNGEGRTFNTEMPLDSVDIQAVRPPTLLNLAYQDVMLWNGQFGGTGTNAGTEAQWDHIPENAEGFQGVEVQAMQGQLEHRLKVNEEFVDSYNYRTMFDAAFYNIPQSERYTRKTAALAIAAFNRTILANQAPWQEYLKGDLEALNDQQKRGANLFFDKGLCYQCHNGPALKDQEFHAFGFGDFDGSLEAMVLPSIDFESVKKGRGGFTQNPDDDYKFKTPTLYNLADAGAFGHGGTFSTIREVVEYKNNGVAQSAEVPSTQLASQFGSSNLTSDEITDLTAFLKDALRDPDLLRYVPNTVNSGNCFPNNDEQSRIDLGCN